MHLQHFPATDHPDPVAELPFPLHLLRPPYQAATIVRSVGGFSALRGGGGGAIHLLAVPAAPRITQSDLEHIAALRAAVPTVPLVVRLSAPPDAVAIRLGYQLRRLGARALYVEGEPVLETLRPQFTQPDNLAEDVVAWLELRGVRLNPTLRHLARQIVEQAPQFHDVCDLLKHVAEPASSTRHRFTQRGLPPSGAWLQVAHALHAALRIQAEPRTSIERIAYQMDYGGHTTISQMVSRCFGVCPSELRGTLGWEWLLDHWYTKNIVERAGNR